MYRSRLQCLIEVAYIHLLLQQQSAIASDDGASVSSEELQLDDASDSDNVQFRHRRQSTAASGYASGTFTLVYFKKTIFLAIVFVHCLVHGDFAP